MKVHQSKGHGSELEIADTKSRTFPGGVEEPRQIRGKDQATVCE